MQFFFILSECLSVVYLVKVNVELFDESFFFIFVPLKLTKERIKEERKRLKEADCRQFLLLEKGRKYS